MLRRSTRLPADVARHLAGGVLAAAELAEGPWAAVTRSALVLVDASGVRASHPWEEMVHGTWEGETRSFTVTWVDGTREPLVLRAVGEEVADFAAALRERIQSSIVHVAGEDLPSGAHARVLIRRSEHGELLSQVTVLGPLAGTDDERVRIYELERQARSDVGLPD